MTGAILGILCIIGVGTSIGFSGNLVYLIGMWYNRVIMGLVIGFAGSWQFFKGKNNPLARGFVLGFVISLALFLSTELRDPVGFGAGIIYGIIIDYVASKYA